MPRSPAKNTFLLDDDIAYETACLFEPMGAGVHGVESAEVAGKTVLVSGCGPIGLTAVSACKTFGAQAGDRLPIWWTSVWRLPGRWVRTL